MKNKWLAIGVLVFMISVFGWLVSVILSVLTLGTEFRLIANIFGYTAAISIPASLALAFLDRKSKKK